MKQKFNLLTEPWITAASINDHIKKYSLIELFRNAHNIKRILGDIETQEFAIFRLCLAVLHRSVDGPPTEDSWFELWERKEAPMSEIESYLTEYYDRFFLFHPSTPFMQVADLHTLKGDISTLNRIILDVPVKHQYFTMRTGQGASKITFDEAARWVVHVHAFDVSGIKTGAVGDPRVKQGRGYPIGTGWAGSIGGVLVEGDSLWETLLLNLIPKDQPHLVIHHQQDRPSWEAPANTAAQAADVEKRPYGPLDLFTWQTRRVRLFEEDGYVTGVLLANGDKIDSLNRHREEPMTAWRIAKQRRGKATPEYRPAPHDPAKLMWRGVGQLLPMAAARSNDGTSAIAAAVVEWAADVLGGEDRYVKIRAIGLEYGTKGAVVSNLISDELTLSVDALSARDEGLPVLLIEAVKSTELAVEALRKLASNLVLASSGAPDLARGAASRAVEEAYAAIDPLIRNWIMGLGGEISPEWERNEWHKRLKTLLQGLGSEFIEVAGANAWIGREVRGRRITVPEAAMWFERDLAKALPTSNTGKEVMA